MGLAQRVDFEPGRIPAWQEIAAWLAGRQFPVQVRMIDGALTLPDELPPEPWRELRIGTPAGMVTLRRDASGVEFVIWGNADPALQQASNALAWAFAEQGGGTVATGEGRLSAAEFARTASLPPVLPSTS